jgi:hypothetical protein
MRDRLSRKRRIPSRLRQIRESARGQERRKLVRLVREARLGGRHGLLHPVEDRDRLLDLALDVAPILADFRAKLRARTVGEHAVMVFLKRAFEAQRDDDAAGHGQDRHAEVAQGADRVFGRVNVHAILGRQLPRSGA